MSTTQEGTEQKELKKGFESLNLDITDTEEPQHKGYYWNSQQQQEIPPINMRYSTSHSFYPQPLRRNSSLKDMYATPEMYSRHYAGNGVFNPYMDRRLHAREQMWQHNIDPYMEGYPNKWNQYAGYDPIYQHPRHHPHNDLSLFHPQQYRNFNQYHPFNDWRQPMTIQDHYEKQLLRERKTKELKEREKKLYEQKLQNKESRTSPLNYYSTSYRATYVNGDRHEPSYVNTRPYEYYKHNSRYQQV